MTEEKIRFIRNFQKKFVVPLQEFILKYPETIRIPERGSFGVSSDLEAAIKGFYLGFLNDSCRSIKIAYPYKKHSFNIAVSKTPYELEFAISVFCNMAELFCYKELETRFIKAMYVSSSGDDDDKNYLLNDLVKGLHCIWQIIMPDKYGEADEKFIREHS